MAKRNIKKGKGKLKPTMKTKKEDKIAGSARTYKEGRVNSIESHISKIFWFIIYNLWCKLGRTIAASLETLLRMVRAKNEGDDVELPLKELAPKEQPLLEQKPETGKAEEIESTAEAMNPSEGDCEISPSAQNSSKTLRHRTSSEFEHAVSERIDLPPIEVHYEAPWVVVEARRASNASNKSDTSKPSACSSTETTVTCDSTYPSEAGDLDLGAGYRVLDIDQAVDVSAAMKNSKPLSRRVAIPRQKSIVWTEEFISLVPATDRNWPLVGSHFSFVKHSRGQEFAILPKGPASVSSGLEHLKAQTEKTDEDRDRRDDWPPATVSPVLVDFGTSTWAYVVAGKESIAKASTTTAKEGDVSIGLKQSETQHEEIHSNANESEAWTEEPSKQSADMKPSHMRQDSAVVFEDADASQQSDVSFSVRDSGLQVEETDGREQLNVSPALNDSSPQIQATDNEELVIVSTTAKDCGTQSERADDESNGNETHAETSANHTEADSVIVSHIGKHSNEEQEQVALPSQQVAMAETSSSSGASEELNMERKPEKRSTLRNRKKKDSAHPTVDLELGNPQASVGIPTCDPTADSPSVSPTVTNSKAQDGKCIERALNFLDFENEDDNFDDLMDDFKAKGWKPFNDEEYQRSTRRALSEEGSVESIV